MKRLEYYTIIGEESAYDVSELSAAVQNYIERETPCLEEREFIELIGQPFLEKGEFAQGWNQAIAQYKIIK